MNDKKSHYNATNSSLLKMIDWLQLWNKDKYKKYHKVSFINVAIGKKIYSSHFFYSKIRALKKLDSFQKYYILFNCMNGLRI